MTAARPRISVIIPTYNHEAFVGEAIRSVGSQTLGDPIELIVVDDTSRDDTFARAQQAVAEVRETRSWAGIRVERNPVNRGAHATISDAIAGSSGELVTILNSDDIYLPTRLERLAAAMAEQRSEFGFTRTKLIDATSLELIDDPNLSPVLEFAATANEAFPALEFAFLRHQIAISTGNMLFTRRLYDRIGGFASLRYVHDWDFALAAILLTRPTFVDEPLYAYRIHGTNSFAALAHLAEIESEVAVKRYFTRVLSGFAENSMAPTPRAWPAVFEHYLSEFGLLHFWQDVVAVHPRYALR